MSKINSRAGTLTAVAEEATARAKTADKERAAADALARAVLHEDEEQPAAEAPSRLDVILATVAEQGKFDVYRQSAGGQKSKVGIYPINEYPDKMEVIARTYKGGTFIIYFKDAHGRIRGQDTQTFDAIAYTDGPAPAPAPTPASDGSSIIEKFFERMERLESERRVTEAQREERRAERDMKMMELLAGRKDAPPADSGSIMEAIKLGQSMAAQAQPKSALDGIKEVVELVAIMKEGAEASEPKSPWLVALEKTMETLTPILSVLAQKAVGVPARGPRPVQTGAARSAERNLPPSGGAATLPPPASTLIPTPEPAAVVVPPDPETVKYAQQLLGAANAAMKPSILAMVVVDALTEESVEQFETMLSDTKTVDALVSAEPKLAPHRGWLEQVMEEVRVKFDEVWPAEPEEPTAAEVVGKLEPEPAPAPEPAPGLPPLPDAAGEAAVRFTDE